MHLPVCVISFDLFVISTQLDYCQSYPSDLSDVEGEGNGTDKMEDVVQQFGMNNFY